MSRKERIEKMLHELRYEIEVGMMQGDIDETLSFRFVVPTSKAIPDGVVVCEFRTRPTPTPRGYAGFDTAEPRLRVVK